MALPINVEDLLKKQKIESACKGEDNKKRVFCILMGSEGKEP